MLNPKPKQHGSWPLLISLLLLLAAGCSGEPEEEALDDGIPEERAAYTFFRCESIQRSYLTGDLLYSEKEAELFRRTLAVMATSPEVMHAALRNGNADVQQFIEPLDDPVAWLQEHLDVDVAWGSDVLYLALPHETASEEGMKAMLAAVKDAFVEEVALRVRLRSRKSRDVLVEYYRDLNVEIENKSGHLSRQLEDVHSILQPSVRAEVDLIKEQIRQLETERIVTQCKLLDARVDLLVSGDEAADSEDVRAQLENEYQKHLADIQEQIDERKERVIASSRTLPDLESLQDEINVLKAVRADVAKRIEYWEIQLKAPDRISPFSGIDFFDPDEVNDFPK